MKNKICISLIFIIAVLIPIKSYSDETFTYEADKIKILNSGKTITGENNIKIIINKNIFIDADKLKYDRINKILELSGNLKLFDKLNKTDIESKKIIYYENEQLIKLIDDIKLKDKINNIELESNEININQNSQIIELINNVKFFDNVNNINIETEKIVLDKKNNLVYSPIFANIEISENYKIKTNSFKYFIDEKTISSQNKVLINDIYGNSVDVEKFKLQLAKKKFKGSLIKFYDEDKNEFIIENGIVDLKNNKILGKDLKINFNKSLFGNPENDPRLKARSVKKIDNISSIEKGVFTICNKDDDCPPWSIYADKIEHNSETNKIKYENALLKIYDVPVAFLPKFSHPDPTVKRQSGFLNPYIKDSRNLGSSITIPYYFVISDNKDFTFSPKVYADDELVLQNEYRQKNKYSEHIFDFSLNSLNFSKSEKHSKGHFFINSKFNPKPSYFDDVKIISNFEKVSNDNYLKLHKLDSKLIDDTSLLNSYLSFNGIKNNASIDISLEVYESLSKPKSDRYEFVYPNYSISNNFGYKNNIIENINLTSYGHQKKYNTNIYEGIITNDILISTYNNFTNFGIKNNFETFIKNVNSEGKNSDQFKNEFNQSVYGLLRFNNELPLTKENEIYESNLTPKVNFMYSPNKSKNIINENKRINIDNIYSLNRLGNNETVEGGFSSTLGFEYKKIKKNDLEEVLGISLATVIRAEENEDLPKVSTIGQKNSDIFGKITLNPKNNFNLNYNFALDNNLDKSNYNLLSSELKVNNFVTKFEFSNDDRISKKEKHISNSSTLTFSKNGLVGFDIKKNKITNATEFYNLYYSYFNDCLEASVKFSKDFYYDKDINPEKTLEFTITIIPFTETTALTSLQ